MTIFTQDETNRPRGKPGGWRQRLKRAAMGTAAFVLAFAVFDAPQPAEAFTRVSNTDLAPKNRLVIYKEPNVQNFSVTLQTGTQGRGKFDSRSKYGSFQQEYGYRSITISNPYQSDRVIASWGNVGTYDGRPIDMTATFDGINYETMFPKPSQTGMFAGTEIGSSYLQISESPYSGFTYFNMSHMKVTYRFFDRATGNVINVPGSYLTFSSLNGYSTDKNGNPMTYSGTDWETGQTRTVSDPGLGEFVGYDRESTVYVRNDTNIARRSHSGLPYTGPVYIGTSNDFIDVLGSSTFTKNAASFELNGSYHPFTVGSGKRNSSWVAMSTGVMFRPEADPLQKQVVSTSGANLANQDIPAGTTFKYRVTQKVHVLGQDIIDKYASFTIRDDLPADVTYQSARLLDQYGNAVSNAGTINHSGGVVTYTAGSYMLGSAMQYEGESYTLEITVRANPAVAVRTTIQNRAERTINNDTGYSNTVQNVITPNATPPPPPPPPTDPTDPPKYNITAYHVHAKSGSIILTESQQVTEGDSWSFSSKSYLRNGSGYSYIPLAPTSRSGVATGDMTVYLYYDLPLVDIGLKSSRIYTDEPTKGLPIRVEFDPTWIDASNPSQLSGYTATITVRNMTNGRTYVTNHPLTSMDFAGTIPASVLSGSLRDRYDVSFTVSDPTYIVTKPGTIQQYGYRSSYDTVDVTGTSLSYTGVVMTSNVPGGAEQTYRETLTASTSSLPRMKTGYGFPLNMRYTYTNELSGSTEIMGLNNIPSSPQPVNGVVNPTLIDSHIAFSNPLAGGTHPKGTVTLVGTGVQSGRTYTENYTLPGLYMESVTGNLFTLEQVTANDPRITEAIKPAGQKLYVPIWAEPKIYDYRFDSVGTPRGANKVRFVLRNTLDVYAHMFHHTDSGTIDDDELLLTPLNEGEAERMSDTWYTEY